MSDIRKYARLGGYGGMLPQENFLEIRCSEIASEAIWDGSRTIKVNYMARRVLHPIFGCSHM